MLGEEFRYLMATSRRFLLYADFRGFSRYRALRGRECHGCQSLGLERGSEGQLGFIDGPPAQRLGYRQ
jgi:hypothetical protein